jgi:hypothetical protein
MAIRPGSLSRAAVRVLPALLAFAATSMALAQQAGPRQPKIDTVPSPVIGYGIVVLFAIIILSISLYPSKRAHSDL